MDSLSYRRTSREEEKIENGIWNPLWWIIPIILTLEPEAGELGVWEIQK